MALAERTESAHPTGEGRADRGGAEIDVEHGEGQEPGADAAAQAARLAPYLRGYLAAVGEGDLIDALARILAASEVGPPGESDGGPARVARIREALVDVDGGRALVAALERRALAALQLDVGPAASPGASDLSRSVEAALERLAGELTRAGEPRSPDPPAPSAARPAPRTESPPPARVHPAPDPAWSVDRTVIACARYLAGWDRMGSDAYGFDRLEGGRAGRAKRVDEVTVKFEPARGTRVAASPPGELKARTLVALLALAADAPADDAGAAFRVSLRDLMALLGHRLGTTTSGRYYYAYAAEVLRIVLVDLPNRVVAMQLELAGRHAPVVVFDRLLAEARAEGGAIAADTPSLARALVSGDGAGVAYALRRGGPPDLALRFGRDVLDGLGLAPGLRAVQRVPAAAMALRGPAWWLAWHVAFLTRWAPPPRGGRGGRPLTHALEEARHLQAVSRGGRLRLKDALRRWWGDVGRLVELGLLVEPGVRIYRFDRGWRDVSDALSRRLDARGTRLSPAELRELRVVYTTAKPGSPANEPRHTG